MQSGADGWRDVIDVNLTGVHNTVEVAMPTMVEQGDGGSIVLISSAAGLVGVGSHDAGSHRLRRGQARRRRVDAGLRQHACAAQHSGQLGAPRRSEHPDDQQRVHPASGWAASPTRSARRWATRCRCRCCEPEDIANAVAWLVSDEARYVTGHHAARRRGTRQQALTWREILLPRPPSARWC